jgi:hypothetical protein
MVDITIADFLGGAEFWMQCVILSTSLQPVFYSQIVDADP